jgi:hypothetical protein
MPRVLIDDDKNTTKMPYTDKAMGGVNEPLISPVEFGEELSDKYAEPIGDPVHDDKEPKKPVKNNNQMYLLIGVVLLAIIIGVMLYKNMKNGESID